MPPHRLREPAARKHSRSRISIQSVRARWLTSRSSRNAFSTRVYEEILAGRGCGLDEARPSIELAYRIRKTPAS